MLCLQAHQSRTCCRQSHHCRCSKPVRKVPGRRQHLFCTARRHYSAQGREPLLYAIVLLLTLQPRTAVAFLARHASTGSFRVDAVHLAIALVHHQVSLF